MEATHAYVRCTSAVKRTGKKTESSPVSDNEEKSKLPREKSDSLWATITKFDVDITSKLAVCAKEDSSLGFLRPLMKFLEISCHGVPWISGVLLGVLMSHQLHLQTRLMNLLIALFVDLLVVIVCKSLARRQRPSHNQMDMFGTVSVDKFSFPSGHTTRAAMLACFLLVHFPGGLVWTMTIISWCIMVSTSRILLGRHHFLDVVFGFMIGVLQFIYIIENIPMSPALCASILLPIQEELHL